MFRSPGPLDGDRVVRCFVCAARRSVSGSGRAGSALRTEPCGPLLPPLVRRVVRGSRGVPVACPARSRGVCTRGVHGACPARSRDDATSPPTRGRCKPEAWSGRPRQVPWRAWLTSARSVTVSTPNGPPPVTREVRPDHDPTRSDPQRHHHPLGHQQNLPNLHDHDSQRNDPTRCATQTPNGHPDNDTTVPETITPRIRNEPSRHNNQTPPRNTATGVRAKRTTIPTTCSRTTHSTIRKPQADRPPAS